MKLFRILPLIFATTSALVFNDTLLPSVEIEGRIRNGYIATENQFPYQVGLFVTKGHMGYVWCSGALISNQWVLTTAYCVMDATKVNVYLGSTVFRNGLSVSVSKENIIIHKNFNRNTASNDIALIKIRKMILGQSIDTIDLPRSDLQLRKYENKLATISGWGEVSIGRNLISSQLLWSDLKVISNTDCKKVDKHLLEGIFCATNIEGRSPTKGDGGSPLVSKEKHPILLGICGTVASKDSDLKRPIAFINVADYLGWIYNYIN